jgi:deoxyadenosine/deoxycytidine kinase
MPVYFVEGNIGTGKSTFLKMVETHHPECQVIYEPVDTWTSFKDKEGVNILGHFYKDPKRYAYTFQNIAFISKIEKLSEIDESKVVFVERSIWSDKNIFAKNCYMSGLMNDIEYQVYNRWFEWIESNAKKPNIINFVYLKCTPETSHKRVNIRSRSEESGISVDYLTQIHDRHEEWFQTESNVRVIDAELDYTNNEEFEEMFKREFLL